MAVAISSGLLSGVLSALLTSWFQRRLYEQRRRDERFDALKEFVHALRSMAVWHEDQEVYQGGRGTPEPMSYLQEAERKAAPYLVDLPDTVRANINENPMADWQRGGHMAIAETYGAAAEALNTWLADTERRTWLRQKERH